MKIFIIGKVEEVKVSEFEGKKTYRLQFLDRSNGLSIVDLKLKETEDISKIKIGDEIQTEVKITSFNNKCYYTQLGDLKVTKK